MHKNASMEIISKKKKKNMVLRFETVKILRNAFDH